MAKTRAKKGTVVVESYKGMLRLRWSYYGQRYTIATGTPDTGINRTVAEAKAKLIEGDIATGNFDDSLAKYRHAAREIQSISVTELLKKFTAYKAKALYDRSLDKYRALENPIAEFFGEKPAAVVDEKLAEKFWQHLSRHLAPVTQRERLNTLSACWKWGIEQKLVTLNPWPEVLRQVKVAPKQRPKPFVKAEVQAILEGFRADRHYCHYADFVEFLMCTGCRIGEAVGLQWKHLSHDCSVVWIGEAMTRRGERKPTKTNQPREFHLSPKVQAMLQGRFNGQPETALVFPSPKGSHIDDHNFCRRAWRSILSQCDIPYRTPYNCRHTFISHALQYGEDPMRISEMVGHSVEVLFRRYAAYIGGRLQSPELF